MLTGFKPEFHGITGQIQIKYSVARWEQARFGTQMR